MAFLVMAHIAGPVELYITSIELIFVHIYLDLVTQEPNVELALLDLTSNMEILADNFGVYDIPLLGSSHISIIHILQRGRLC